MNVVVALRRLAPLLVMALIHYFSSLPGTMRSGPLPLTPGWLHNLLHVPTYASLAVSGGGALPKQCGWRSALLIGFLTVAFGVVDEWHQSFVPGRPASAADLLRDAIGAGIGLGLTYRARPIRAAVLRGR